MYRSPLIWGYNFIIQWSIILGVIFATFIIGNTLNYFNIRVNFYIAICYFLYVFYLIGHYKDGIVSVYDNYGIFSFKQENNLIKLIFSTGLFHLISCAFMFYYFYGWIITPMYNSLWLICVFCIYTHIYKHYFVGFYYLETNRIEGKDNDMTLGNWVLPTSILEELFKLIFDNRFLARFYTKYPVIKVFLSSIVYTLFSPIYIGVVMGAIYLYIWLPSFIFKYDYKNLWITQKIEGVYQYCLNFILNYFNIRESELIFFINIVFIIICLILIVGYSLSILIGGSKHKLKLLSIRYSPQNEENSVNYTEVPFKEYTNKQSKNQGSNNFDYAIKKEIVEKLIQTGKLSDVEICNAMNLNKLEFDDIKSSIGNNASI